MTSFDLRKTWPATLLALQLGILAAAPAAAQGAAPAPVAAAGLPAKASVADVVKASKPSEWRPLDPDNTLYLELPAGRVVIELAPTFAPRHVANIKAMAREHYYDGLPVLRVQDNFVAQWGDPDEKNPKPLKTAQRTLPGEFTIPIARNGQFVAMPERDGYAAQVGHSNGMPSARDPKTDQAWLAHCYGALGVGRDNATDSGGGTELYVVIGQSPRQLDRDITVAGRVVAGMPLLASLPRGAAPMGYYDKPEMATKIVSVRLAADVPAAERSELEVMRSESASFQAVIEAQRNRGGPWATVAAGYINVCNATIPVRPLVK